MRIRSTKSKHAPTSSVLSRNDLSSVLSTADALEKVAPSNITLSDEITFTGSVFKLSWIEKKGNCTLDSETISLVDGTIVQALTECMSRRLSARKAGLATQELPADSKQLALNKAVHEARTKGIELVRDGVDEELAAVTAEDPRNVLLVKPQDEPLHIEADYLVSGSNVVGGPSQLLLYEDTLVDVTYFLHDAPYSQIRAKVPLGLAEVKNLATRIRGEFIRAHPEDSHLSVARQPEIYVPERVAHKNDTAE